MKTKMGNGKWGKWEKGKENRQIFQRIEPHKRYVCDMNPPPFFFFGCAPTRSTPLSLHAARKQNATLHFKQTQQQKAKAKATANQLCRCYLWETRFHFSIECSTHVGGVGRGRGRGR